jgi:HSP20 family protein
MLDSIFSPSHGDEPETTPSAVWAPRLDLTETDDAYRLEMDLPGLHRRDITLQTENHHLQIRGERRKDSPHDNEDRIHGERHFGPFYRSVQMPDAVDEDRITARLEHGVLTVELPKSEASQPTHIDIT